jgi:hypothetical protein
MPVRCGENKIIDFIYAAVCRNLTCTAPLTHHHFSRLCIRTHTNYLSRIFSSAAERKLSLGFQGLEPLFELNCV